MRIYGENTLELKGMPLGKTPEYVQVPVFAPKKTSRMLKNRSPCYGLVGIFNCFGQAFVS